MVKQKALFEFVYINCDNIKIKIRKIWKLILSYLSENNFFFYNFTIILNTKINENDFFRKWGFLKNGYTRFIIISAIFIKDWYNIFMIYLDINYM